MQNVTMDILTKPKPEWLVISEVSLKTAHFATVDDFLGHLLQSWLEQLAVETRAQIALELYTTEQVSSGRAAEIAGLNYFVFLEKLKQAHIPFIAAEVTSPTQQTKAEKLLHGLLQLPT